MAGAKRRFRSLPGAIRARDVDGVQEYIAKGAPLNKVDREDFQTPLGMAVELGDLAIVQALISAGADVSKAGWDSGPPLCLAALRGHIEIVEVLLAAGADANSGGRGGDTPLMCAAHRGHLAVVERLVAVGADPNRRVRGATALYSAAAAGAADVYRFLLPLTDPKLALGCNEVLARGIREKARRNDTRTGEFILAAARGQLDEVRAGLDAGIDANAFNEAGNTALHLAASLGHLDVVRLLLERGADVNLLSDKACGETPLGGCLQMAPVEVVRLLLDHGADPNLPEHEPPLDDAVQLRRPEVVALLLDHGADPGGRTREELLAEASDQSGLRAFTQFMSDAGLPVPEGLPPGLSEQASPEG